MMNYSLILNRVFRSNIVIIISHWSILRFVQLLRNKLRNLCSIIILRNIRVVVAVVTYWWCRYQTKRRIDDRYTERETKNDEWNCASTQFSTSTKRTRRIIIHLLSDFLACLLYPLYRPLSPRIAGFPITPSSRFIYAISSPRPSIMDINRSRPNVCCLGPTPFDKICSLVSCLKLHAKRILPFFFHPSLLFPTTGINPYSEELYCSRL